MKCSQNPGQGRRAAWAAFCAALLCAAPARGQMPLDGSPGQPPDKALLPAQETPCVEVRQIGLQGDEAPRFAWLLDALAGTDGHDGPLRRCLGTTGMGVLVRRAQDALIERGFVTSRVLVEPQDLQQGQFNLTVLPGRIRQVRFAGPATRPPSALTALGARPGAVLNLRDIEQALENFQRAPSAQVDIQIEPADEPGQSDLVVTWSQKLPLRLDLNVDDSGPRQSARYQGSARLAIDNPLALNDLFHLGLQGGLGHGRPGTPVSRGRLWHYSVPWGAALLALDASRHRQRQRVAGLSQDYVYLGMSASQELTLSWVARRDARSKTTWHARAFAWQSNNFIDDTEVEVQRRRVGGWQLGVGHRTGVGAGAGTLELNLNVQRGTGAFGSLPAPEDAFGEGTSRFLLLRASAHAVLPFQLAGHPWKYTLHWRAQRHRTPLSAQDRFAIGGRTSVRGFDGEYSLSAESGWSWRNEIATPLGDTVAEVFAGLDHGRVRGPSAPLLLGTRLTGAVVGLRSRPTETWQAEVFAGWPLHMPEGFRTPRTTVGFSLATNF